MIDWLNTNSGAVQGLAAIASVLVLLGLATVTWNYARQTRRIAEWTEQQAKATSQMVREAYAGRVAETQPRMTIRWSTVSADKQLNEAVPLSIEFYGKNNGRGTAVKASWRLRWPGWRFSASLMSIDFAVGDEQRVSFTREDREDNYLSGPEIVVYYQDVIGRVLRQGWMVEIENESGACSLGEAVPDEEVA